MAGASAHSDDVERQMGLMESAIERTPIDSGAACALFRRVAAAPGARLWSSGSNSSMFFTAEVKCAKAGCDSGIRWVARSPRSTDIPVSRSHHQEQPGTYSWPGNVHELKFRAVRFAPDPVKKTLYPPAQPNRQQLSCVAFVTNETDIDCHRGTTIRRWSSR